MRKKQIIGHACAIGLGVVSLAMFFRLVIGELSSFNTPGESVFLEFSSYFWQKNYCFSSIPHFANWHSDFLLYPYGIDVTYINWFFELQIFGTLARSLGISAWLQLYYLLSLAITFAGSYAITRRYRSSRCALLISFVLTFCNYAAICKYPAHYTLCIIHWSVLSILLDIVMIEKFWRCEPFSARFLLFAILCIMLCFGLELGYIASFACFSMFVCVMYIFISVLVKSRRFTSLARWICRQIHNFFATFKTNLWQNVSLCACILLLAWTYVPVIVQILLHNATDGIPGAWPTNPLRVLHPILPWFNPATTYLSRHGVLGSNITDTIYAWSAGLTPLACAIIGITKCRLNGIKKWLPFLLILALVMSITHFSPVSYFPAFKCSRVPERFSCFLVVLLLAPFILSCDKLPWHGIPFRRRACYLLLAAVGIVEIATAYSKTFLWLKKYHVSEFADDYRRAVVYTRNLPGESLFFFPFNVIGGNGEGFIGPLSFTSQQMQFAAKCGKKLNSCYVGRMYSSIDLKDFPGFAWRAYYANDEWTEDQWIALKRYFKSADFAALVVVRPSVTDKQYAGIVSHFGPPMAEFDLHGQHYGVIPLSEDQNGGAVNLTDLSNALPTIKLLSGFSSMETWGVWTIGKEFSLLANLTNANGEVGIAFWMKSFHHPRTVEVYAEAQKLATFNVQVEDARYIVNIPSHMASNTLLLRFTQDDLTSPHELHHKLVDTRTLGVGICSVELITDASKLSANPRITSAPSP